MEAEVVKGDLHHHQVIPTDPIHSPGRQKASRRYTQYLDITCLLINLKAVWFFTQSCGRVVAATPGHVEVKLFMNPKEEKVRVLISGGKNKGF